MIVSDGVGRLHDEAGGVDTQAERTRVLDVDAKHLFESRLVITTCREFGDDRRRPPPALADAGAMAGGPIRPSSPAMRPDVGTNRAAWCLGGP